MLFDVFKDVHRLEDEDDFVVAGHVFVVCPSFGLDRIWIGCQFVDLKFFHVGLFAFFVYENCICAFPLPSVAKPLCVVRDEVLVFICSPVFKFLVKLHCIKEILTIEVRGDVLAVEIEGLIGLASVRRYPIGGIVVGGVVIADGVVFARMEVVGFYYVQILGLVFVDGEEALEGFARVHIHHLKGVLVVVGYVVTVVQKQLVSHTVDSGAV